MGIKVIADRQDIVAIADAVRGRLGTSEEMTLSEIVDGVNNVGIHIIQTTFSVTDDGNGNITITNN